MVTSREDTAPTGIHQGWFRSAARRSRQDTGSGIDWPRRCISHHFGTGWRRTHWCPCHSAALGNEALFGYTFHILRHPNKRTPFFFPSALMESDWATRLCLFLFLNTGVYYRCVLEKCDLFNLNFLKQERKQAFWTWELLYFPEINIVTVWNYINDASDEYKSSKKKIYQQWRVWVGWKKSFWTSCAIVRFFEMTVFKRACVRLMWSLEATWCTWDPKL